MTSFDRAAANMNSVVGFLHEFSQENAAEVSYTYIDENGDETVITHDNITMVEARIFTDKATLERLVQVGKDSNEPTGFIRDVPMTMGVLELSPDGALIQRLTYANNDSNVSYSESDTNFNDGSAAAALTVCLSPYTGMGNSFDVYVEGIKYNVTEAIKTTLATTIGLHYVFFDTEAGENAGDPRIPILTSTLAKDSDFFTRTPITATIYINNNGQAVLFGDERHGIQMDGLTHEYLHMTVGCRYGSGMGLNGVVDGQATFTGVNSGVGFDEDLIMTPSTQATLPTWWYKGTIAGTTYGWQSEAATDTISYNAQYNGITNDEGTLTALAGSEHAITFIALTNDAKAPYVKIVGQVKYADEATAQIAAKDALAGLSLVDMPTAEFLPIASIIFDASGNSVQLSNGVDYYDLRQMSISGAAATASSVAAHIDLTGRDVADAHPASAITGLTEALENAAGIVQIKHARTNTITYNSSITPVDTALSITFTKQRATSAILVQIDASIYGDHYGSLFVHDSTNGTYWAGGTFTHTSGNGSGDQYAYGSVSEVITNLPAGEHTITLQLAGYSPNAARTPSTTVSYNTMTVMEIHEDKL